MKALLLDFSVLGGLGVIVYGVGLVSIPAAWITGGCFLVITAAVANK